MEATSNGHAQSELQSPNSPGEPAEDAVQATQESLDQVRDILFGGQARDTQRRFSELETHLASQRDALHEETRKSLSALEDFVKSECAALAARIAGESNQRQEALQRAAEDLGNARRESAENLQSTARTLSEELKSNAHKQAEELRHAADQSEKRSAAFDQQHASAESDIRKELLAGANAFRGELKERHEELRATIENLVAELRGSKTDRAALASLFAEMAGKLQS